MGKIWFPGGGGGADLDAVTAGAGDVLAGKVIVGADGEPLTGTLALSGTAADSQVLSGQTYYNTDAKTKRTGTMTNRGAWNGSAAMNGSVTIPAGYHNGSGKVTGPAITNRGAYGGTGNSRGNDAGNSRVWVKIPGGYYNENANVYISYADLRNMLGVTADKIKKNVSILGLIGSFEGYVTSPFIIFGDSGWGNIPQTGFTATTSNTEVSTMGPAGSYYSLSEEGINQIVVFCRLNSTINLSSYNYVNVNFRSNNSESTLYVGVSTASNVTTYAGLAAKVSNPNPGAVKLNVASLSGNYFIYIGCKSNSSSLSSYCSFDEIWLSNS